MKLEQVKHDIFTWIQNFVEVPHPALNGWAPCPYARAARIQGTVDVQLGSTPAEDLKRFAKSGMGSFEVVALVYDPVHWPLAQFRLDWIAALPYTRAAGLYILEDHPSEEESVNGVVMNQGQYAILFVQLRNKLESAARQLASKGYYQDWPRDYLDGLFEGREDPTL
jgi:hypothetical protein